MIFTNRMIKVSKGKSSIDEPVILYRGDFEVELRFAIMETNFRFKSGVNLVDTEKASHAQLALLAPDGTNVFTEIGECEDGTAIFILSKDMIDELSEVGKYSFQIRLFDSNQESRITIPPVEFGIEVREPVASEDHTNAVDGAMTGYSIAKTSVLDEEVSDTFDTNGQYNKTEWETGDRISEGKLNKIENAIDQINQNEIADKKALNKQMISNFNVLQSQFNVLESQINLQIEDIENEYAKKNELENGEYVVLANIEKPAFVREQQDMTDPEKIYVLDGYLWAYMEKKIPGGDEVPNFTNQILISKDTINSDTIYNDCGYKTGHRLNSSGVESEEGLSSITGFISCKSGDIVRLSSGLYPLSENGGLNTHFYNSSGVSIGTFTPHAILNNGYGTTNTTLISDIQIVDNELRQFTISSATAISFRLNVGSNIDENSALSINEEITYRITEDTYVYTWINTGIYYAGEDFSDEILELETSFGEQLMDHENRLSALEDIDIMIDEETPPEYWIDTIASKCEIVKGIQKSRGKDAVSFVWASDTHIPDNNGGRTNNLGKIMNLIMNECEIPFSVISGDMYSQSPALSESVLIEYEKQLPVHLFPLWGSDRLLMCVGNHDGVYGQDDLDGDGVKEFYRKQLPPARIWQTYFRGQALDFRRVFSDDGSYFYVDNTTQKLRFIVLNSQFGGEYSEDQFGYAINDRFNVSCYGQHQLDWLADNALNMPEGYSAIIITHVPIRDGYSPYTKDYILLKGIITAYCNKTTYSGSITDGVDGWTNGIINKDFTSAQGEIIAVFSGHGHTDFVETLSLPCPVIQITTAGGDVRDKNSDGTLMYPRTKESATETALDIVTIDKVSRKIYCTRVGAGIDREINY